MFNYIMYIYIAAVDVLFSHVDMKSLLRGRDGKLFLLVLFRMYHNAGAYLANNLTH